MNNVRCALGLIVSLAAVRSATAAEAVRATDAPRFSIAVEVDSLYRRDHGYDLFSQDSDGDQGGGVSLSYDLLPLGQRGTLAVGLGWSTENLANRWGSLNQATLDVGTYQAAATFRYSWRAWLEPHVRVATGVSFAHALLTVNGEAQPLEGKARSLMTSAGAGLRVRSRMIRARSVALGASLAVEAGMMVGTPLDLGVKPRLPAGDAAAKDHVPTQTTALGALGRVHPYARLSLAVLF